MLRRPLVPLAGLALLLPLASCSADEATPAVPSRAPVAAPTTSTSAPVTPAPTTPTSVATVSLPAPTFRPEGTFTEDDAIGFAAYYLLVINHARATGDSSVLRRISEPSCGACAQQAEAIDVARIKGLTARNLDVHFDSGTLEYFSESAQEADVLTQMTTRDGQYLNADGTEFAPVAGSTTSGLIQVHLRDGQWLVEEVPG